MTLNAFILYLSIFTHDKSNIGIDVRNFFNPILNQGNDWLKLLVWNKSYSPQLLLFIYKILLTDSYTQYNVLLHYSLSEVLSGHISDNNMFVFVINNDDDKYNYIVIYIYYYY